MSLPRPDLRGSHGDAWLLDFEEIEKKEPGAKKNGVACWVLDVPSTGPIHYFYFCLVHLGVCKGIMPIIYVPGATHEVGLAVVSPMHKLSLEEIPIPFGPMYFRGQLVAESDVDAAQKVDGMVKEIVGGGLCPCPGCVDKWTERFGGVNIAVKEFDEVAKARNN